MIFHNGWLNPISHCMSWLWHMEKHRTPGQTMPLWIVVGLHSSRKLWYVSLGFGRKPKLKKQRNFEVPWSQMVVSWWWWWWWQGRLCCSNLVLCCCSYCWCCCWPCACLCSSLSSVVSVAAVIVVVAVNPWYFTTGISFVLGMVYTPISTHLYQYWGWFIIEVTALPNTLVLVITSQCCMHYCLFLRRSWAGW